MLLLTHQLEIVDQWSTRMPPPSRSGYQWAMHWVQLNILQNHQASISSPRTQVMCYSSLDLKFKAKLKLELRNRKIHYLLRVAILKTTLLKINKFFPNTQVMYYWSCLWPQTTCTWNLKFKFQSQFELRSGNHAIYKVQIPRNLIWPPGGQFERDIAENQ